MNDIERKGRKTGWVVIITAVTMVVEIAFGIISGSMALLADGIHMGSHVLAIGLSWIAYQYIKRRKAKETKTDNERVLSLAGYTSGLLLLFFAIFIIGEAVSRFIVPVEINYRDAILVAFIGLFVNIFSAFILHDHSHKGGHDHNMRAAYLHVIADALTSLSAIIGLFAAMIWGISYIDTLAAIISSFVIIKWSIGLLRDSGRVLLQ
jgi:cation diffusion facilitator family transporter